MALSRMTESTAATSAPYAEPAGTFVMSLRKGWDEIPPEDGGRAPVAGDVAVLCVIQPETPVTGPSGWTAGKDGRAFWKTVTQDEPDPVFRAPEPARWLIRGYAISGTEVRPFDDSGSAAEWVP